MELSLSYMKRIQFEAQQTALQVAKLFGGVSEQVNRAGGHTRSDPLKPGRTNAPALLGSLGFNPKLGRNKVKH